MNVTLSADEQLIRSARRYARQKHTTLNGLLRQYMQEVSGANQTALAAEEFRRLASSKAGESDAGFVFNRAEAHQR